MCCAKQSKKKIIFKIINCISIMFCSCKMLMMYKKKQTNKIIKGIIFLSIFVKKVFKKKLSKNFIHSNVLSKAGNRVSSDPKKRCCYKTRSHKEINQKPDEFSLKINCRAPKRNG